MVIKSIFFAFLFFILPPLALAEPQLLLELNKTEIQLGHHIDAQLYGIDLQGKLIDVDLTELRESFAVNIVETIEELEDARWPGKDVQFIQFKLYPRETGQYTLPSLVFSGAQSDKRTISVTHGFTKTRSGDAEIVREISLSSAEVRERQQLHIWVTITTTDTFSSLQSTNLTIPGFEIFPIPAKREKVQRDGVDYSVLSIGWLLFPLVSGQYNIDMPPIEYRQSGRTLRIYFSPTQKIIVKALPPYIPPTMPVGKVRVSSALRSDNILSPSDLSYWDLIVTGYGVSPSWMPPVMRQVKSGSDIQFFSKETQSESTISDGALQTRLVHHIPFKPLVNGWLDLPSIRFQYFDPHSRKIITATHHPQQAFVLGTVWRVIIGGLISLLLVLMAKYSYQKIVFLRNRRQRHQLTFREIHKAETFMDLHKALNHFATAEGWPINLTIRCWAKYWASCFKQDDDFHELLDQLSHACYSKESSQDLAVFRALFMARLRSSKRKTKYLLPLQRRLV